MYALSIKRCLQLIKIDAITNRKSLLILATVIAVLLSLFPHQTTGNHAFFFFILMITGFSMSASSFKDMHDKQGCAHYLTIPASVTDRFLAKWLQSSILFSLAAVLLYYLSSWVCVMINHLMVHEYTAPLNITDSGLWLDIKKYLICQSIFLFGGAYFKKNPLMKTVLTVSCLYLVVSLIVSFYTVRLVHQNDFYNLSVLIHNSFSGVQFLFWIILAPVCWIGTYLCIKNHENK